MRQLAAEGLSPVLIRPAVQLAAGVAAASELIHGNWFAEARNVVIQLMKETYTSLPQAMLTLQNRMVKGELAEHVQEMLDLQLLWFKDMIHHQIGRQEKLVFIDQTDWMTKLAFSQAADFWIRCMEHVVETQKRLRQNAGLQITLEKLVIDIQGG